MSDKSPRVSEKSPHVKDKSPQSQLKSPRKSGKTPRPEPTGADAPDVASKTKQTGELAVWYVHDMFLFFSGCWWRGGNGEGGWTLQITVELQIRW